MGPTMLAVAPFLACQFSTAAVLKGTLEGRGIEVTAPVMLGIGATAGAVGQTVVYPLDVLRRRMQLGGAAKASVLADTTWAALRGRAIN